MDQVQARYVQHVEAIRVEYADWMALAVRAMASLRYAQLTTGALIEELNRANILVPGCADTVRDLWHVAHT
jgi:hypothetical protein